MQKSFVQIAAGARRRLEEMARAGYPHETCGLLIGRQTNGSVEVGDVLQARNLDTDRARDHYVLDPADWARADATARGRGEDIVGIWHSHPDHPARPSETDRAAAWAGWSYVIVSVTDAGITEMRSWRLNGNEFYEEVIQS